MSDKLQEIKRDYHEFLEQNPNAALMNLFVSDYVWLIEQLEQAQAEKEVIVKELGEMTLLIESETYWANLLEQVNTLQAANQKLVEALESIEDISSRSCIDDIIYTQISRQVLSEVKGNETT